MSIQHYVAANANPVRPDEATHYRHLVTYADHLAAIRDCEERMLNAAREAVEAIPALYKIRGDFDTYGPYAEGRADFKDAALSAIDALREKQ